MLVKTGFPDRRRSLSPFSQRCRHCCWSVQSYKIREAQEFMSVTFWSVLSHAADLLRAD